VEQHTPPRFRVKPIPFPLLAITGKTVGGLISIRKRTDGVVRKHSLYTMGSIGFLPKTEKRELSPASWPTCGSVSSAEFFPFPGGYQHLESVLTIVGGNVVSLPAKKSQTAPPLYCH